MMNIATELEETITRMLQVYEPFSSPGKDWLKGGDALMDLVRRRDQALAEGKAQSDRFRQLWTAWEATAPNQEERARIFQARNRIVEMGLEVSRSDTSIQTQLKRKVDELKRKAVESDSKSKVAKAYAGNRSR